MTPELVAQLRQPETPTPAAAQIARAMVATGAEEGLPALRDFLTMYRADPAHDADPSALIAVAEALIKLGGAGRSPAAAVRRRGAAHGGGAARAPGAGARRDRSGAVPRRPRAERRRGDAGLTVERPVAARLTVVVCRGPTCGDKRGSGALAARLAETVAARGLEDRVRVVDEVCLGHCLRGPNILVQEEGAAESRSAACSTTG